MKLSLVTLSLTALLTLTCFCQLASGQSWTGQLFTESSHDFGDVSVGQRVEHRFKIVNSYDSPISITKVSTSAGLFIASATTDAIAPGETAEIVCEITPRHGMLGIRSATVTVALSGKDQERGEYQMSVRAKAIASPKFNRSSIEFPDVNLGQEATADLKLSVQKAANHRLVDVRSSFPNVRVRSVSTKDAGGFIEYDLKIRLLKTTPKGAFKNSLLFDLQARNESQESKLLRPLVLPFTGNVVEPER